MKLRFRLLVAAIGLLFLPLHAQVVCQGDSIYLNMGTYRGNLQWQVSTDGGTTWNNISGATTNNYALMPSGPAQYRGIVTEGTCAPIYSTISNVTISGLMADAGPDRSYCSLGQPVTIGGSPVASGGTQPYTYSWSPPTGLSSPVLSNPTAAPNSTTNYVLTVVDGNGCMDTDTMTVFYNTGGGTIGDSAVFSYSGSTQIWVVPACVTQIEIKAWGAQGENALVGGATGGLGGYATGLLAVTGGETLYVEVGGQAGYNGGGNGGINGNDQFSGSPIGTYGGKGGGASDVRQAGTALGNRVIVAGGGGGAGHNGVWPGCQVSGPGGNGGTGGGSTGGTGTAGVGSPCNCGGGGGAGGNGGTQAAGGAAGAYAGSTACLRSSWSIGQDGSLGLGGNGATTYHNGTGGGGGGGGGYYGGGSGGNGSDTTPGGGGGGGSSYTGGVTSSSTSSGVTSGNGLVKIFY